MKVQYLPSEDELILEIYPIKNPPTKELGHFKLWWDKEGNIRGVAVTKCSNELKDFEKNLNVIQLGGIWKGIRITDRDIKKVRKTLFKKLEEKW